LLLYPEVAGRSLEEVNLLFTSNSLLANENMKEYRRLIDEAGGNVAVAERRLFDSVDAETEGIVHNRGRSNENSIDVEYKAAAAEKDGAYEQVEK
jgi:hypothetical protein